MCNGAIVKKRQRFGFLFFPDGKMRPMTLEEAEAANMEVEKVGLIHRHIIEKEASVREEHLTLGIWIGERYYRLSETFVQRRGEAKKTRSNLRVLISPGYNCEHCKQFKQARQPYYRQVSSPAIISRVQGAVDKVYIRPSL